MKVFGENVLIEKIDEKRMTGLILPYEARIPLSWGVIKQIGDGVKISGISVGDKVLYVSGGATLVTGIKDVTISSIYIYAKEDAIC